MSAKTSAARRAAFFRAVAETGNQTLAAERAKVSRAWVTLHRSTDAAFRAELEAALRHARGKLREARAVAPDAGWGAQRGEELAVRGTNGRLVQVARARVRQWTPRLERRFLDVLARCCNVHRACAAVGLSVVSAYNHRNRWDDFARRWDEALEDGYDRLELALLDAAGRMLAPGARDDTAEPDLPITGMTAQDALQLLRLHRSRVHGLGKPPGRVASPPSSEQVDRSIRRMLGRIERARRRAGPG